MVGYSEKFSNECLVRITVDPERPNEARITLNEEACAIAFYCELTFEALEKVYKDYVNEAKKIPKDANPVACVVRLRKGDVMCLPSPEKKELLYYLGNGNCFVISGRPSQKGSGRGFRQSASADCNDGSHSEEVRSVFSPACVASRHKIPRFCCQ